MPDFLLRKRRPDLVECMDRPDCHGETLDRTFAAFRHVNRMLSGWGRLYRTCIRPALERGRMNTLLDVGCGGGDVLVQLVRAAKRDGYTVTGIGVDPDPRAISWAQSAWRHEPDVQFRESSLDGMDESFDVVVSNHVLHHLSDIEAEWFLKQSLACASRVVVHNDISRNATGLVLFQAVRIFFPRTFIGADGTVSIRRSFRMKELLGIAGPSWKPVKAAPFRIGVVAVVT